MLHANKQCAGLLDPTLLLFVCRSLASMPSTCSEHRMLYASHTYMMWLHVCRWSRCGACSTCAWPAGSSTHLQGRPMWRAMLPLHPTSLQVSCQALACCDRVWFMLSITPCGTRQRQGCRSALRAGKRPRQAGYTPGPSPISAPHVRWCCRAAGSAASMPGPI